MDEYTVDNIIAGVVTFNPNIDRLRECLAAILKQVHSLIIFDNGSRNVADIVKLLSELHGSCQIIKNGENAGIAYALAAIMDYARAHDYKWVLTLDQDSILQAGIIDKYLQCANNYQDAAMITCLIHDRNFYDPKYEEQGNDVIEVPYCITSAAFTNVDKYFSTSGYDSEFFIDCVDFDICYSLREAGYKIYRVNHVGLLHEVGHGEQRRFLWKKIIVYHEAPWRIYYLARNTKLLAKRHTTYGKMRAAKKEIALLTRILLYEDKKKEKLKMYSKGIHDSKKID